LSAAARHAGQRVVIRRVLADDRIDDIQPRVVTLPDVHPLAAAPAVAAEQHHLLAAQHGRNRVPHRLELILFQLLRAHRAASESERIVVCRLIGSELARGEEIRVRLIRNGLRHLLRVARARPVNDCNLAHEKNFLSMSSYFQAR